jgi:hypothetical protein
MPVIVGAHSIIYSKNADADRAFLRDVIGLPNVDVGDGWLIFALPPAEVAVHPGDENDVHEFYLMVKDLRAFLELMKARSVACTAPRNLGWGVLTEMSLPGGGKLGVYEPRSWVLTFRKPNRCEAPTLPSLWSVRRMRSAYTPSWRTVARSS